MKNPLTPAAIEPATFRFVAQHLNHCATAVPSLYVRTYNFRYIKVKNITIQVFFSFAVVPGYLLHIQ